MNLRLALKLLLCRLRLAAFFRLVEFCTDCGIEQPLVWWSPDAKLWAELNGGEAGALCPECFDRRATKAGYFLRWYPHVEHGNDGQETEPRDIRQRRVHDWCATAFGADHATSIPQRGIRHAEEAIEVAQAAGCDQAMVHKLVDHVYSKEPGKLHQEIGGSGITLLALAQAAGLSADAEEVREMERVLAKPLEHFAARNKVKNDAGFNVASDPNL